MRKKIAFFCGQVQRDDYYPELIDELSKEARKIDADLFVMINYGIFDHNIILYAEGEKSIMRIPELGSFDAILVDESMFHIEGMNDELYEHLQKHAKCPVIYLKSQREGFYSVLFSDKQSIKDITNHFIKEHGFTRIYHMAGRWELQDAHERADGYREAMEEAGLEVTDDMIFFGDYWKNKGKEAADHFLSLSDEYPQAIVCANDYMAVALSRELVSRGIRIPEDICISGYDNALEGQDFAVPMTTFEADGRKMAKEVFAILDKLGKKEEVPEVSRVSNRMILRNSCGCSDFSEGTNLIRKINLLEDKYYGYNYILFMINSFEVAFDEVDIFSRADFYFKYSRAEKGYICLTEDAFDSVSRPVEKMSDYTDRMILKRVYFSDPEKRYLGPNTLFDRRDMLPQDVLEENGASTYMIVPLHAQNKVYGYVVLTYAENCFPNNFLQSYIGSLGSVIDNYNMRKHYLSVDEMRRVYLKDELTGIYNRRGFEQNLNILSDRANRHDLYLSVVSLDMDGLKRINDEFGHAEGDASLSEFASVLLSVLEGEEICARYGGDEFAAILISKEKDRHLRFTDDLEKAFVNANEMLQKPYKLHASSGVVCVNDHPNETLRACVILADKVMYENKKKYKASLGEKPR
ncbi:MAG: GGDEF domain-containing protein [Lachnospiraceae bacterium]|nr:GGDEF domain-containing protein [Lachnospiraceae bacterium]